MNRRNVLRVVALGTTAVIGGCISNPDGPQRTEPRGTEDPIPQAGTTETTTSTGEPEQCDPLADHTPLDDASLNVLVSIPDETPHVTADGYVSRSATSSNPPRIDIRFQNTSTKEAEFQFGSVPPVSDLYLEHASEDSKLVLLPNPVPDSVSIRDRNGDGEFEVLPDSRIDGCWRAVDVPFSTDSFETVELSACEAYTASFHVLGHPDNSGCPPSGRYERTDEWSIRDTDTRGELSIRVDVSDAGLG